jgi:fluoride ion exporter CrcB/FEX
MSSTQSSMTTKSWPFMEWLTLPQRLMFQRPKARLRPFGVGLKGVFTTFNTFSSNLYNLLHAPPCV